MTTAPHHPPTRADVVAAAEAAFPAQDTELILALLDQYGSRPYDRERERVHLAIIALSQGDEDRLLQMIAHAMTDYRDVISWVETGPLSPEEGEKLRGMAREIVARWGTSGRAR